MNHACGYTAFFHEQTHEMNYACGYTAFGQEQTAQGYTVHYRSARPDILRRSPMLSVNIAWRMAKIHCATVESESTMSRTKRRESGVGGGVYKIKI